MLSPMGRGQYAPGSSSCDEAETGINNSASAAAQSDLDAPALVNECGGNHPAVSLETPTSAARRFFADHPSGCGASYHLLPGASPPVVSSVIRAPIQDHERLMFRIFTAIPLPSPARRPARTLLS